MLWELNETLSALIRYPASLSIVMGLVVYLFGVIFPYVVAAALMVHEYRVHKLRYSLHAIISIFGAAFLAYGLAEGIKSLFPFPRPYAFDETIVQLLPVTDPLGSFPSAHAAFFAALGTALYLREHRLGKWFLFFALVVGLARVAGGVHWAFDIIDGYALGVVVALLLHFVLMRLHTAQLFSRTSTSRELSHNS